jgi:hypothetical protein
MFDAESEWVVRIRAEFQQYDGTQRRMAAETVSPELPSHQMLADLLDVAFWASLTTNEGRPTRVRIAMVPTGSVDTVLAFKYPIAYTEEEVTRLAPAAWSTGWLAVDVTRAPGWIWGISRGPLYEKLGALTIEISDPGIIRVGFGPLQSFVIFAGRSAVSSRGGRDVALTARLGAMLGKDLAATSVAEGSTAWRECLALSALARMVLEDRHGGTLLVVPNGAVAYLDSLKDSLKPFIHQFMRPDTSVRDSIVAAQHQEVSAASALTRLERMAVADDVKSAMLAAFSQVSWHPETVLRPIARLAAVDGAVVLTDDLQIVGFGAMISVEPDPDVYRVTAWPEHVDSVHIEEAGGARHQSAVRFVGQHRDSIALVISHDGHLSLAHWSDTYHGVLFLKNAEWWM